MKQSLPLKANAEHLKKQAKALHKACLDGDRAAVRRITEMHPDYQSGRREVCHLGLQETQWVIAREYGFSSWPALLKSLSGPTSSRSVESGGVLILTNGRNAIDRLEAAGIEGEKLEWLEVLHEGPVPRTASPRELRGIRAAHFARLDWVTRRVAEEGLEKRDAALEQSARYRELQLWFEHDLFDQLQLIQILDRLSGLPEWAGRVVLYQFETYLGLLKPEQLRIHQPAPLRVDGEHLRLAREVWNAFCGPDLQKLSDLAGQRLAQFPFLPAALRRFCEEFPCVKNGLGRTEGQILAILADGASDPEKLFRSSQTREQALFAGDAAFYAVVRRLNTGPRPMLVVSAGGSFRAPAQAGYTDVFREQILELTDHGAAVLNGKADWLEFLSEPYWLGGAEIKGPAAPRWDSASGRFI